MLNKIAKILGIILFIAVFSGIVLYLFYGDLIKSVLPGGNGFLGLGGERFGVNSGVTDKFNQTEITIVEPMPLLGFEPTIFDPFTRQRLNNIYETLIKPDKDLNMMPALAISWGLLDDTTWEFNLRKDVKFHDGSKLDSLDAIYSIDRAVSGENSQLKDLLSTIKEVKRVDVQTIQITTYKPDPLLLQRLSTVYIVPEEFDVAKHVGTAAYKISSYDSEDGTLVLEKFDDYWGKKVSGEAEFVGKFKKATFLTISDKDERIAALQSGRADVLAYVPYDLVDSLPKDKFDTFSVPSLEVQFLVFNFKDSLFKDVKFRKALDAVVDRNAFAEFVGKYAHGVNQFVSSGIFGYDPKIGGDVSTVDEKVVNKAGQVSGAAWQVGAYAAERVFAEAGQAGVSVSVLLPMGLDSLGDFLTKQFEKIGLKTDLQYVKSEVYEDVLKKVHYDLYFLGFKSELGDASDFLKSVVHTGSPYNFTNYSNSAVDKLIEEQEVTMNAKERLSYLQEAMKILVEDDVFGVPLLEYEIVYATKKGLSFEPRIDGFVYLNDL